MFLYIEHQKYISTVYLDFVIPTSAVFLLVSHFNLSKSFNYVYLVSLRKRLQYLSRDYFYRLWRLATPAINY